MASGENKKTGRREFLASAAAATGAAALGSADAADQPTRELNLKGYSIPLTPEGKASLVTPTPHHYGGQFIFVDDRADVDQVARYLPAPLDCP